MYRLEHVVTGQGTQNLSVVSSNFARAMCQFLEQETLSTLSILFGTGWSQEMDFVCDFKQALSFHHSQAKINKIY